VPPDEAGASKHDDLITMGFAELSVADIAAEYDLTIEAALDICERLGIAAKDRHTRLALEDAKAVMLHLLERRSEERAEEGS